MMRERPQVTQELSASAVGVLKTFAKGSVIALKSVDFVARFGEVTAIVGANGSGKSTLLKTFFGLGLPDSGSVRTLGLNPASCRQAVREQVGYVSQHQALDPEMTGQEMLSFFCALYGLTGGGRRDRIDALVQSLGLEDVIRRRTSEYSGGFRQRLHLAISLIHEPRLLLLDEPTSGLDPGGRATFWEAMRSRADDGLSVIVVTHDLEEVARQSDRVTLLCKGAVCIAGTPKEIVAAHGRTVVEIELDKPPNDWSPMRNRLEHLVGVDRVTMRGRTVTIETDAEPLTETTVSEIFTDEGLEPVSSRRERPSLSSAYFQLTGQSLGSSRNTPSRQRSRGGRR